MLVIHKGKRLLSFLFLGPPVERLELGHPLFSVVYFSRGTLPQKKGKRGLLGDLLWMDEILHNLRNREKSLFVGICRVQTIPRLLRWCRILSIHSRFGLPSRNERRSPLRLWEAAGARRRLRWLWLRRSMSCEEGIRNHQVTNRRLTETLGSPNT